MSDVPISGPDEPGAAGEAADARSDAAPDFAAAKAAGWSAADLEWEAKAEAATRLRLEGEQAAAEALWVALLALARAQFSAKDPRLATSLANLAAARGDAGGSAQFAEARRIWDASGFWIEAMALTRRARSSLFHLRLEAKHKARYDAQVRQRLLRFAGETRENLQALEAARPAPHRGWPRWRAEKPARYGEERKFLAACLLLTAIERSDAEISNDNDS